MAAGYMVKYDLNKDKKLSEDESTKMCQEISKSFVDMTLSMAPAKLIEECGG